QPQPDRRMRLRGERPAQAGRPQGTRRGTRRDRLTPSFRARPACPGSGALCRCPFTDGPPAYIDPPTLKSAVSAGVAKLVDATDLGSVAERRGGSTPLTRTSHDGRDGCRRNP